MYAVFSTGGKQYRATTGDIIKVEKLDAERGATIELDRVLMIGEGEEVKIGAPYLSGSKVTARIVEHGRGEKVKIVKFKRRKNYLKRQGHRQYFTALEITGIEAPTAGAKKEPEAVAEVEAKVPASKTAVRKKSAARKTAARKKSAPRKTTVKKAQAKQEGADSEGEA
jgi:large subunit ribosomal protein L21